MIYKFFTSLSIEITKLPYFYTSGMINLQLPILLNILLAKLLHLSSKCLSRRDHILA